MQKDSSQSEKPGDSGLPRRSSFYASGFYSKVPLDFTIAGLAGDGAILLAYIINQLEYCVDRKYRGKAHANSWINLTIELVKFDIGFNSRRQQRWLSYLKKHGFIKVQMRGIPQTRWVQVQHTTLESFCHKAVNKHNAASKRTRPKTKPPRDFQERKSPQQKSASGTEDLDGDKSVAYLGDKSVATNIKTVQNKIQQNCRSPSQGSLRSPDSENRQIGTGDFMFFEEYDQSKQNLPVTMFDHYVAKTIYAIALRVQPGLRWRKSQWADQIRLLRCDLNQDTDRIELTLDWLVVNWKVKNIRATSAKWFRRNFTWIEGRMLKEKPPVVKLCPIAQSIKEKTKRLIWAKSPTPNDLDEFIENSVQNYIKFFDNFRCIFQGRDNQPKLKGVIEHIYRKLTPTEVFVKNWVEEVHKRCSTWEAWSGSLTMFVFSYLHKDFQRTLRRWIVEYTGNDKALQPLLLQLNKD